jgi:hypothetical protein
MTGCLRLARSIPDRLTDSQILLKPSKPSKQSKTIRKVFRHTEELEIHAHNPAKTPELHGFLC